MSTSNIQESNLSDVCALVTDGTHDTPKTLSNGTPFIKAKEIVGGIIDFKNCEYISYEDHLKVISRSKPERGDTLFAHIGASLGEAAYIKTDVEFSIKNIALFKPNPLIVDSKYLFYYVINSRFQDEIKNIKTGSAQPFVGLDTLRKHKIQYHVDLKVQRKIAAILSAYDDLIENNLRRIETLEEIAHTLYREWFVNFRFPGHEKVKMVDSPMGKIPEGWEVKSLNTFGTIVTGKTPSKLRSEYFGKDVPFIKIPDMHNNMFVINTNECLSTVGAESQKGKILPPDSLCVSCIGTAGVVSITAVSSQTNQQINSIIVEKPVYREFLYFSLIGLKEIINQYGANGATMVNLNKGKFENLVVACPSEKLLVLYSKYTKAIFDEIKLTQCKNSNLRRTRDLLLPKLISGGLDVTDLDIKVGEAG